MQKEIFDILVEKYLAGQASDEEKQLMEEYLERMGNLNSGEFSPKEVDQITSAIYTKIHAGMHTKRKPAVSLSGYAQNWIRVAAVAAGVLVLAGGYYFSRYSKDDENLAIAEASIHQPLTPGSDKAILTLGDGSQLVLDSAGNGTIASQGLAKVTIAGKNLIYDASKEMGNEAVIYNTVSTPRGGQYQVTLADGSKVWLNALASIRFPTAFRGKERSVEITGEAYFEVAKDTRPFHVKVNGMDVKVLGTHFNINAYRDESSMKTTLLEGAVQVTKGDYTQLLSPGQQAGVTENDPIKLIKNADIEQAVAWKNGQFNLTGINIREIMRQISRWYGAEIVYQGDVSGIVFYGFVSRTESISKLLTIMEKTGIVHFRIDGEKIVVSK